MIYFNANNNPLLCTCKIGARSGVPPFSNLFMPYRKGNLSLFWGKQECCLLNLEDCQLPKGLHKAHQMNSHERDLIESEWFNCWHISWLLPEVENLNLSCQQIPANISEYLKIVDICGVNICLYPSLKPSFPWPESTFPFSVFRLVVQFAPSINPA